MNWSETRNEEKRRHQEKEQKKRNFANELNSFIKLFLRDNTKDRQYT